MWSFVHSGLVFKRYGHALVPGLRTSAAVTGCLLVVSLYPLHLDSRTASANLSRRSRPTSSSLSASGAMASPSKSKTCKRLSSGFRKACMCSLCAMFLRSCSLGRGVLPRSVFSLTPPSSMKRSRSWTELSRSALLPMELIAVRRPPARRIRGACIKMQVGMKKPGQQGARGLNRCTPQMFSMTHACEAPFSGRLVGICICTHI